MLCTITRLMVHSCHNWQSIVWCRCACRCMLYFPLTIWMNEYILYFLNRDLTLRCCYILFLMVCWVVYIVLLIFSLHFQKKQTFCLCLAISLLMTRMYTTCIYILGDDNNVVCHQIQVVSTWILFAHGVISHLFTFTWVVLLLYFILNVNIVSIIFS